MQNMKTGFLFSIFFLCLAIPPVHGMEQDNLSELNKISIHLSEELNQDNITDKQKICCLASLASYGDAHEGSKAARAILETLNFEEAKSYDNPALALKMELWVHTDERIPIIATRGTIPTYENILSDVAIFKYAVDSKEPYNYVSAFLNTTIQDWEKDNFINTTINPYLAYLPTDSSIHSLKLKGGTFLGGLGLWGLSSLALTPLGAAFVVGVSAFAGYQVLDGYLPETKAIYALLTTSQMALKTTNEWASEYSGHHVLTGHSLGGFVTNTVAELSEKQPQEVWTFNAPGGAERFIRAQKKYIMGEQDDNMTWLKKSFVLVEENFPHDFRKITKNIGRKSEIISCFGREDASRSSILVEKYSPQCRPMDFQKYLMENHSIYNLAKDLGVLKG